MEHFEKRVLRTKRSLDYTFYVSPTREESIDKPVLLFLHGFPDNAHLWRDVIYGLSDLPFRMIVPDMLGYGGTSKPTATSLYEYSTQAEDLVELLHAEKATSVVVIGHDWGAAMAQQFYLHRPELVVALVLLNHAYIPPTYDEFDLGAVNARTERVYGYPLFSYWEFFASEDGPEIMKDNLGKFWEILHGDREDWMREMFCVPGAMKAYLLGNERVSLKSYAMEPRWKNEFLERFSRDGFEAPVQWYRAVIENIQSQSDKMIPADRLKVGVPVLFIGCTGDAVLRIDLNEIPKKAGLLPDLEERVIQCDHWSPMEKPKEIASYLRGFLTKQLGHFRRVNYIRFSNPTVLNETINPTSSQWGLAP